MQVELVPKKNTLDLAQTKTDNIVDSGASIAIRDYPNFKKIANRITLRPADIRFYPHGAKSLLDEKVLLQSMTSGKDKKKHTQKIDVEALAQEYNSLFRGVVELKDSAAHR